MKKLYLLVFLLFFVLVGCSKDEEKSSTLSLPNLIELNKTVIEGEKRSFQLTLGQGENILYYILEDKEIIEPGSTITLVEGIYSLGAVTVEANNGSYNKFLSWSDGNKNERRLITFYDNLTIEAFYQNQTDMIFLPNPSIQGATVEIHGYGVLQTPGQYGGIPTETYVTVSVNLPVGYKFSHWYDGNTDITREIFVMPQSLHYFYLEPLDTWSDKTIYNKGDRVVYDNKEYIAKWVSVGEVPGESPHSAWEEVVEGNEWNATKEYKSGDIVTFEGNTYRAKWWTKGVEPTNENSGFELL